MIRKEIDEIIKEVGEDKFQNPSTTSYKFKRGVWDFFSDPKFLKLNCVEFGTHKGQTTRLLSFLFNHVYTINLAGHFSEAKKLNYDVKNISFIEMDLYNTPVEKNFKHKPVNVFFIDAVHTTDAVLTDFARSKELELGGGDVYYIFDDYGLYREVYHAIEQLVMTGQLEKVQYIGHEPNHTFNNSKIHNKTLNDWEGVICKLVR